MSLQQRGRRPGDGTQLLAALTSESHVSHHLRSRVIVQIAALLCTQGQGLEVMFSDAWEEKETQAWAGTGSLTTEPNNSNFNKHWYNPNLYQPMIKKKKKITLFFNLKLL